MFKKLFLSSGLVLAGLILICALVSPVQGAPAAGTLRVTTTGTTSWPCGDTWATACALQTALTRTVSGDEVWVAKGLYTPTMGITRSATFQMVAGAAIYGGFAMTETARDQRNWTTNVVTLSGDLLGNDGANFTNCDDNSYHVVIGANNATLDGVTVAHGYASTVGSTLGMGGGMYNQNISGLTVNNAIFRDNYAEYSGGGLESFSGSGTISNVLILHNASANGAGLDAPYTSLTLVKVSFIGNAATDWGGGLKVDGNATVNLSNVTFSGNSAPLGGGIDTSDDSYGVTTLNHVTFSGNSGRAISSAAHHYFRVYHSVLWGDSGGSEIYSNFAAGVVISNSVVQGGYYGGGTNMILTEPRLGTLGYYGGSTPVLPLLPGSAAINGDSTTCPTTDQRGAPRGTVCDLGAYEARPFNMTYTSGSGQSSPLNLTFGQPLVLNISSLYGDPVDGGILTLAGPLSGSSTNPITTTATITSGLISRTVTANGTPGTYTVTASTNGAPSLVSFELTNLQGNTTTSVTSSPNPSIIGQLVTFTATVTSTSGTPDGAVQFYADGGPLGEGQSLVAGKARLITTTLSAGTHLITATSTGSPNYLPSTSSLLNQIVNRANTLTTVTSSLNPSIFGQTVTFTAQVTSTAGLPTGSITFTLDSTAWPVPLNAAGTAVYVTNTLAAGVHAITATYSGDENFLTSSQTLAGGQVIDD